ncbi:MAG TPA: hypothetical protein VJO34_01645 [Methylomirabilota bacterium]|nr:hypothetical protein [Methylomirabilota bacterium]
MHRRLNITLSDETVRLLDRAVPKGDRSRLIAETRYYMRETSRATLRKRLREGAMRRAERDRKLAGDWFGLEEEAWRGHAQ